MTSQKAEYVDVVIIVVARVLVEGVHRVPALILAVVRMRPRPPGLLRQIVEPVLKPRDVQVAVPRKLRPALSRPGARACRKTIADQHSSRTYAALIYALMATISCGLPSFVTSTPQA